MNLQTLQHSTQHYKTVHNKNFLQKNKNVCKTLNSTTTITNLYTSLHAFLIKILQISKTLYTTIHNFTKALILFNALHNFQQTRKIRNSKQIQNATKLHETLYNFTTLYKTLQKYTNLYMSSVFFFKSFTKLYTTFTHLYKEQLTNLES